MRIRPTTLLNFGVCLTILFSWAGLSPVTASPMKQLNPPGDAAPGILIVGYRKPIQPSLRALPGKLMTTLSTQLLEVINAVKIQVPPGNEEAVKKELLQNQDVLFVELDYPIHADLIPDDSRWSEQYGPTNVRATDAWDITTGSKDVTIAILDSGIDANHPEFNGRLVPGYDFAEGDSIPQDACGHGTHVAGIAAANGNNQIGITGINWQARIMPIRVLLGNCNGYASSVVSGVIYAVEHGAKVINLSFGFNPGYSSESLDAALEYAFKRGVAIFAAAGNNAGAATIFPASSPWVMAVGAVDRLNQKANYSNFSNQPNQRMVMAPGTGILSTTPLEPFTYERLGTKREYGLMSGTSMATPHVAGAAALLAGLPGFDTPDKIYQALSKTALDLGVKGWDEATGYGLIQIDLAMGFTVFSPPPEPSTPVVYDMVTPADCQIVEYSWADATDGVPLNPATADSRQTIDLPFVFSFGGQDYKKNNDQRQRLYHFWRRYFNF